MSKGLSSLSLGKKKVGVTLLAASVLLTVGAVTALGADDKAAPDEGNTAHMTSGIQDEMDGVSSLDVKSENGVTLYSEDRGESWSEAVPEGVTVTEGEDGTVTISSGDQLDFVPEEVEVSEVSDIAVKSEDGVVSYSTDGGESWSEEVPEGLTVTEEDGRIYVTE